MSKKRTGEKTKSGNFWFKKEITCIEHLIRVLQGQKSVWWRHKVYPTAFIKCQQLSYLIRQCELGLFWEMRRINHG